MNEQKKQKKEELGEVLWEGKMEFPIKAQGAGKPEIKALPYRLVASISDKKEVLPELIIEILLRNTLGDVFWTPLRYLNVIEEYQKMIFSDKVFQEYAQRHAKYYIENKDKFKEFANVAKSY